MFDWLLNLSHRLKCKFSDPVVKPSLTRRNPNNFKSDSVILKSDVSQPVLNDMAVIEPMSDDADDSFTLSENSMIKDKDVVNKDIERCCSNVLIDDENELANPIIENDSDTTLMLDLDNQISFQNTENNELSTDSVSALQSFSVSSIGDVHVYYITDLHILHFLRNKTGMNFTSISGELVKSILSNLIRDLFKDVHESGSLFLFGGDICTNFEVFKIFVTLLCDYLGFGDYENFEIYSVDVLKRRHSFSCSAFLFILGNHEFWSFDKNQSVDDVVSIYRDFLNDFNRFNNFYLLHNDLVLCKMYMDNLRVKVMSSDFALSYIQKEIDDYKASILLFGGTGFSAYDDDFNAKHGIYANCLNEDDDMLETLKFEELYYKLLPILSKYNGIVFTHTPKSDWCHDPCFDSDITYVYGHTHNNYFYSDSNVRVYADNQIGYHSKSIMFKYFLIDQSVDPFKDYEDGIYEINASDYRRFYGSKFMRMTFNRKFENLYMLKRSGYYCFMLRKKRDGDLFLLLGGRIKKLCEGCDIEYYYDRMNFVVDRILNSICKFNLILENVSNFVKSFSGSGEIHGCIVDINGMNHLYVNPFSFEVIPYFARSKSNKYVYSSIANLLEDKCPNMYAKYIGSETLMNLSFDISESSGLSLSPEFCKDTDMYSVSDYILNMQKLLNQHILTLWINNESDNCLLQ